jgi:UDP-3-O-[3-hydroxymyristoyl] glucosamine N-acyltransferase
MRLSEIVEILGNAEVLRDREFYGFGLLEVDSSNILSAYYDQNWLRHLKQLTQNKSIVTRPDLAGGVPDSFGLVVTDRPSDFFWSAVIELGPKILARPDARSYIAPTAKIHKTASIAEENVYIGERSVIGPNATIMERVRIGDDVRIGPNSVLGGDGYEVKTIGGHQTLIPHFGGVVVGDRVVIKSNVSVDWDLFDADTSIGEETIIDNLVHIAHSVKIGRRCMITACTMIAGDVTLEDDVRIGPNATISNALRIGRGSRVTLGSVVTQTLPPGSHVTGNFAIDHKRFLSFVRSVR